MEREFNIYGVQYNFTSSSNDSVKCLDWFLPLFKEGGWESDTFKIFECVKDRDKVAVDIGAWIGPTSIWLSNNFKNVISIEPDPIAYKALKDNLKNSNCNNAITVNRPCYNEEKQRVFGVNSFDKNLAREGLGSSTSQIKTTTDDSQDCIQTAITLKYLTNFSVFSEICFVKVDIEGGEEYILLDLFEYAQKNRWKLYISFHYNWWREKNILKYKKLFNTPALNNIRVYNKNLTGNELIYYIINNPFCSVYFEF
jgi:FkbM family methyltransferase